MQQLNLFDYIKEMEAEKNITTPLSVGDMIGRVVLGECRVGNITKVEGNPNHPFYRTDLGVCFSYEEGLRNINDLMAEAEENRKNYKTIIPADLDRRLTMQFLLTDCGGKVWWAQIGVMEINGVKHLYWKEPFTYEFLEPYSNEKTLKKAYDKHRKNILEFCENSPYNEVFQEKEMERVYWSKNGFFATAEYVAHNG